MKKIDEDNILDGNLNHKNKISLSNNLKKHKNLHEIKFYSHWENPFISHSIPLVLKVQSYISLGVLNEPDSRLSLAFDIGLFHDRLMHDKLSGDLIKEASYLLCTYIDEEVSDFARAVSQRPYLDESSLLVQYHGDAWGGEDAFKNLDKWIGFELPPIQLLGFYEFILSCGWQGRYSILDRGDILLFDLRKRLHSIIWKNKTVIPLGTDLFYPQSTNKRIFSLRKLFLFIFFVLFCFYSFLNLMLLTDGRFFRFELAAWEPPVRTINLAEVLPRPLPDLLTEGWLSAYKHPEGWLLVFRSDGAFDVGKATFKPLFINNIERLANALKPWPGDLQVIGHSDSQPINTAQFPSNLELSKARAETAAKALRHFLLLDNKNSQIGLSNRNISFIGRADLEPVDNGLSVAAFERNRRVEVLWKVIPGLHEQKNKFD